MSLATRLLPESATGRQLRDQWAAGRRVARLGPPVALLRTIQEDPIAANHVIGLESAFGAHAEVLDRAWADAQLAADTTWLGLGVGVRVALVPLSGRFQVVLVEIKDRRHIPLGGTTRNPLLALRRARRRLVSGVVRGDAVERGSAGGPLLALVHGGNETFR